jgi:hypothetical protein
LQTCFRALGVVVGLDLPERNLAVLQSMPSERVSI